MDKTNKLWSGSGKIGSALHNSLTYTIDYLFNIPLLQKSLKSAVGWSAVCDCGMSGSDPITFCYVFGSFTLISQPAVIFYQ